MRVRCTATADYRSNAVGELELECSADGLRIALLGVSSYREGYAPGPPVEASAVCVPWPAVYATRLGERQLQLSVDARNLPLNRFLLVDFVERPPDTDGSAARLPFVLGGAARDFYHGIDRIHPGTSDLLEEGGRFSMTLRRVTRP